MTTIAFAAGILAADSYVSDDQTVMQVCKVARLPGGDVAGCAGDMGQLSQVLDWMAGGRVGDQPDMSELTMLYTDKGVLHLACLRMPGIRVKGNAAIGSGAQGALVAMRMGMSAAEAVKAVAGIDPCTGGEIDILAVEAKRRPRK